MALELTSRSNQPVGASDYPQLIFYEKLLILKDGGSFTLASPTNRSHRVDLRSLRRPCFVFKILCKIKPGDQF